MKQIITILLFTISLSLVKGQNIEKSYSLGNNEKLSLEFEYPELVKISTWDKQEVLIKAKVLINNMDATEDFILSDKRSSNQLVISSRLKNMNKYKNNYVRVAHGKDDDESVTVSRNGKNITVGNKGKTYYNGTEIEIVLEITLPKNARVDVEAKYGMVEVLSVPKDLAVYAKFGGADVKIDEVALKQLRASTSWGQIFSNLNSNLKLTGDDMLGKDMRAEFDNSGGANSVRIETEFGNVFLRKNQP